MFLTIFVGAPAGPDPRRAPRGPRALIMILFPKNESVRRKGVLTLFLRILFGTLLPALSP